MKILIAVTTCEKFKDRADVQRRTWVPDAVSAGVDVRFFAGRDSKSADVVLDVPDDYERLSLKVQGAFSWGVEEGYDFILKTDDDTIVRPERLVAVVEEFRPDSMGHSNGIYPSGFGYVLSRSAAAVVRDAEWGGEWAEDRWTGLLLQAAGFKSINHPHFIIYRHQLGYRCRDHWRGSACGFDICSACLGMKKNFVVACPYDKPQIVEELYKNL